MKETFKPLEEGKMSFDPTVKPVPSPDIYERHPAMLSWPRDKISHGVVEILSDCAADVMRDKGILAFNRHIECSQEHGYNCVVFQVEPSEAYSIGDLNNDLAELIVNRGIAGLSAFAMFERGCSPFYSTVGL
ncbi:hypothetical protein [Providencia rettgeri]|uniref:hypothetical protein n=1 Tax=Providencia rettgeri TaxID=587 RepID=UPI001373A647|nr:hypothetical protein BML2531_17940 [Providencia rettgeri]